LELHLGGNGVAFQPQPFAQGGQPNAVLGGKFGLGQLTFVETCQQSMPLLSSPPPPSRTSFRCIHPTIISELGGEN
jgi:hypothetical protein